MESIPQTLESELALWLALTTAMRQPRWLLRLASLVLKTCSFHFCRRTAQAPGKKSPGYTDGEGDHVENRGAPVCRLHQCSSHVWGHLECSRLSQVIPHGTEMTHPCQVLFNLLIAMSNTMVVVLKHWISVFWMKHKWKKQSSTMTTKNLLW